MMRDPFGNFYFSQSVGEVGQPMMMMNQDPNMPRPLTVADVLKVKPGEALARPDRRRPPPPSSRPSSPSST